MCSSGWNCRYGCLWNLDDTAELVSAKAFGPGPVEPVYHQLGSPLQVFVLYWVVVWSLKDPRSKVPYLGPLLKVSIGPWPLLCVR